MDGDALDDLLRAREGLSADAECDPTADVPRAREGAIVSLPTLTHDDRSVRVINRVDPTVSFDIAAGRDAFAFTVNPYRGCEHGCVYCYARPTHEWLGFSSGTDFETQIVVKRDAAALLRAELADCRWRPAPLMLSGVTDPWQPVERRLRITRGILEVLAECRHPVSVISKSRLIVRDLDLLAPLARIRACRAAISITTLDESLARALEPRASRPADRLRAIRELADAGIETTVMVAPVVPGLNDREIPRILEAARDAGATGAGWVLLRLPFQLKEIFLEFLRRQLPGKAARIESMIRETRGGSLSDPRQGTRMRGEGPLAAQIDALFRVCAGRLGLDRPREPLSTDSFVRPLERGQMRLFEECSDAEVRTRSGAESS